MKAVSYTVKFRQDVKLAQKRHKDIAKLKEVMTLLMEGHAPSERYQDHPLKGEFAGYRECHIEADWLLIYKLNPSEICLVRTGTHSDLFG